MKKTLQYIIFFNLTIYLSGCSPKSVFTEPLLKSQTFKGNKTLSTEKLEALLPQKPNKKVALLPITPGLYFYQLFAAQIFPFNNKSYLEKKIIWQQQLTKVNDDFDSLTKDLNNTSEVYLKLAKKKDKKVEKLTLRINEGNWAMRTFGEPPSYFYEDDAKKNVEKVKTYLKNHGFFNYSVSYQKDSSAFNRNSISVTYIVDEGTFYPFKQTDSLVVKDRTIREILKAHQSESLLKVGDRLQLENYNEEKNRIELLLKNNGYYNFTKDNISIRINDLDTTITKGIQAITFIPKPNRPLQNPNYNHAYPINKVTFISDGSPPNITNTKVDTVMYKDVQYLFVNKKFSPKLLDSKIDIRPNQLYSLQKRQQTEKNLYALEQFQFSKINFDTTRGLLDATIYTKPLDKYQFTAETGGSVYRLVFGPFFNTTFKVRNVRGSASSLETNFRFGFEAQAGFFTPDSVQRNIEMGLNTSIIIPKILAPNFISQRLNTFTPQTRLGVGFDFIERQEYSRSNIKINGTYQWRPSLNKFWQISLVDLNLVNTNRQTPEFRTFLDTLQARGNNLGRSFQQSFISSISASYTYTDNPYGQISKGRYLRITAESGGTTLNLFPEGKIGFISTLINDSLQFFKFLRVNADYRRYFVVGQSKNTVFAYKVNTGIAYSYGLERNLPYEKNFFVGGPNSLRAWRPRTLGPGSVKGSNFDQPGSVLLETSAELRFKIFKIYGDYNVNGALFVDAGNVWRVQGQNTEGVEGSDFQFDRFYKEIAIGTGFGIRFDLSFFVIRLDGAFRVVDPAAKEGERLILFKNRKDYDNPMIFNFGIGYPF
ncbi:MAG: BamA/TamA family outer membrane protein [Arcicella sp.]|nr:BamA/TamA family outer membrane protein [Arcicella sp.]